MGEWLFPRDNSKLGIERCEDEKESAGLLLFEDECDPSEVFRLNVVGLDIVVLFVLNCIGPNNWSGCAIGIFEL